MIHTHIKVITDRFPNMLKRAVRVTFQTKSKIKPQHIYPSFSVPVSSLDVIILLQLLLQASWRLLSFYYIQSQVETHKCTNCFFQFEYSCVFICVARNPGTVAFDCYFFAFSEKNLLSLLRFHPWLDWVDREQITCLKYYSGRLRGLEYRKLSCEMRQGSSPAKK